MKLTTKGRFAVIALLDIAMNRNNDSTPVTLSHISERQNISLSYLEQLFVKLRKHKIVASYKGPGGGYTLNKNLNDLNVAQIIKAVDDNMDARVCQGSQNCNKNKKCLTHDLWNDLTNHVYKYLSNVTLGSLINKSQSVNLVQPLAQFVKQQG